MATLRFRSPKSLPLATSFVGLMDLKVGISIISLFAVLNKVAGVYGMMAVFVGGTLAQLTMYIYAIASLVLIVWGMRKVSEEDGANTLLYAHGFAIDHLVSTAYTAFFAVIWYAYVPHDGRRVANSDAQKEMMGEAGKHMDEAERTAAAWGVWKSERGFSAAVLVVGWLIKVYFIYCLYSYALHLRRGTYHSLPFSRTPTSRHTRHSSTGGGRYSHVRGASVATNPDLDTTLAETLWEEDEASFSNVRAPAEEAGPSPTEARGTGMVRTLSGGAVQQRAETGATAATPTTADGTFTRILGRLSQEFTR